MTSFYKEESGLYFQHLGGTGNIICHECSFNQKIVCFLHSFEPSTWTNTGFQCQSCGKFHEIEYDPDNEKDKKCDCSGTLNRDKILFCPKCKSNNLKYVTEYMT